MRLLNRPFFSRSSPVSCPGFLLVALLCLVPGCSDQPTSSFDELKGFDVRPAADLHECLDQEYELNLLPYGVRPGTGIGLAGVDDTSFVRDSGGVALEEFQGQFYYHPVNMSHRIYFYLDAYHRLKDSTYLILARKYIDRLIVESDEFDGALYFPYKMDFRLHGLPEAQLNASWYSGMAQGECLGAMARYIEESGDSTYLAYAHKVFLSFERLRRDGQPWTVFIDENGCYWIEEYPTNEPSMTLNGFNFAIFGLYHYYLVTNREDVYLILQKSLNTVKSYLPFFRRPGKPSYYGLTFGYYRADYHMIHISQLRTLEKISGDPFFGEWADLFESDFTQ